MAGHLSRRKVCATEGCRGTIGPKSEPPGTCSKCGRRKSVTRWRARHPDPSKGGTAQIERQFATRQEAEDWLDDLKHSARSGTFIDPRSKQTLKHVVDEWRETWGGLKPSTKAGYDAILSREILPRWGKAKVSGITADRIQEWVNQELTTTEAGRQRAPNTVRNIFNVLREVMDLATRRHYIASNPCKSVKLPKRAPKTKEERRRDREHGKRMRILTPLEIRKLAEAMPTDTLRMAVYVAAQTGLRAGELWALRRDDVNLLKGTLTVDETLQEIHGDLDANETGMVFGTPKGEAGDREFTLPAHTLKLLKAHLAEPLPGGNEPDSLIFTTPSGKPVRHNLFYSRKYKPAVRKALPPHLHGLTFHDLRHTCASLTLSVSGGNFYMVKERLGHEDIQTTVNTYGHLVPHADEALAESLSKLFEAAETEGQPATNVRELRP